jgi:hypothetical protein
MSVRHPVCWCGCHGVRLSQNLSRTLKVSRGHGISPFQIWVKRLILTAIFGFLFRTEPFLMNFAMLNNLNQFTSQKLKSLRLAPRSIHLLRNSWYERPLGTVYFKLLLYRTNDLLTLPFPRNFGLGPPETDIGLLHFR